MAQKSISLDRNFKRIILESLIGQFVHQLYEKSVMNGAAELDGTHCQFIWK